MHTSTISNRKVSSKSNINVSPFERILMTAAGSYLLYKGLTQEKKNIS
ncbi:hypothetical protein [Flavobacterium sp. 22076]